MKWQMAGYDPACGISRWARRFLISTSSARWHQRVSIHAASAEVSLACVWLGLVMIIGLTVSCAVRTEPPLVIWFRNAPQDWTPPDQFSDCCVRDEVVLENGRRKGQKAIRLECLHKTVFIDRVTKRVVWVQQWP